MKEIILKSGTRIPVPKEATVEVVVREKFKYGLVEDNIFEVTETNYVPYISITTEKENIEILESEVVAIIRGVENDKEI